MRYFILLLVFSSLAAANNNVSEQLEHAEKLYQASQAKEAANLYEQVTTGNQAALLYNLALSYWQSGEHGKAYGALLKAEKRAPFDSDIRNNLDFFRANLPAETRYVQAKSKILFFAPSFMQKMPYFWLLLALCALLPIFLHLLMSNKKPQMGKIFILGSFFVFFICVQGIEQLDKNQIDAVITSKTLTLRSGPGTNFQEVTSLSEGSLVTIEENKGDWLKLNFTLSKEKNREVVGWAEQSAIFPIL